MNIYEQLAKIADDLYGEGPEMPYDNGGTKAGWNMACRKIAEEIRSRDSSLGSATVNDQPASAAEWRDKYNACWDRYRSEVRYDALKSAALKALNYIENTENELGIKLSCGDALREGLR